MGLNAILISYSHFLLSTLIGLHETIFSARLPCLPLLILGCFICLRVTKENVSFISTFRCKDFPLVAFHERTFLLSKLSWKWQLPRSTKPKLTFFTIFKKWPTKKKPKWNRIFFSPFGVSEYRRFFWKIWKSIYSNSDHFRVDVSCHQNERKAKVFKRWAQI